MDFINNCGIWAYSRKEYETKKIYLRRWWKKRRCHGKNDKRVLNKNLKKRAPQFCGKEGYSVENFLCL